MTLAQQYQVHPWDALLLAVRLASYHCTQVDLTLANLREAKLGGDDNVTDDDIRNWQHESRMERALMAKTAKAAIDAGVAERMVRQVEMEGKLVADAIVAALDVLELPQDARTKAIEAAHRRLSETSV